jgi:hypothetical protein
MSSASIATPPPLTCDALVATSDPRMNRTRQMPSGPTGNSRFAIRSDLQRADYTI